MFKRVSGRIQFVWDTVAAHVGRHPRKYATLGFLFIFLPRWVPPARDASKWLYGTIRPSLPTMTFTWDFVTVPIGTLFLILIWRETRNQATQKKLKERKRDGLVIHQALYGLPGADIDVSDALIGLMRKGRIKTPVTNEAMGDDPVVGHRKRLIVTYSGMDGTKKHVEVSEKDTLDIGV